MTDYLLGISLGPVQEFIAAARRTADLQAGSKLLVELAKAVATVVSDGGANTLIFPVSVSSDGPNKILVKVNGGDPAKLAAAAKLKVQELLVERWEWTLVSLSDLKQHLDEPLADSQIGRFIEFYAAWVPLASEAEYPKMRIELDHLLAGRKALRQFEQCDETQNQTRRGRPKSNLDPSRDSVIKTDNRFRVPKMCNKYPLWLKSSELLDAVSILKRVWGVERGNGVPSTSRMAANGLLPELTEVAPDAIKALEAIAKRGGSGIDIGDLLFDSRRQEVLEEGTLTEADMDEARNLTRTALRSAGRSEYPPYYAILQADGDRMGKLLNTISSLPGHREFSQRLSKFADEAKEIVKKCDGHPVYTGGDDVLALLPANRALECAVLLARKFRASMVSAAESQGIALSDPKEGGTLSVGIVWVHYLEPLQEALKKARAAEKAAKGERNSLAIAVHTRGGEPRTFVRSWGDHPDVDDWNDLIAVLRGDLARGFPYELRALARECTGSKLPPRILLAEAKRVLQRKQGNDQKNAAAIVEKQLEQQLESLEEEQLKASPGENATQRAPARLEEFAQKLVIARFLAEWQPRPNSEQNIGKSIGKSIGKGEDSNV